MTAGLPKPSSKTPPLIGSKASAETIAHGPDIAPSAATEERTDYDQVFLEHRLRDTLARLNPRYPRCPRRRLPKADSPRRRNPRSTQPQFSPNAGGRRDGRISG